jgi:hypothetical protein
MKKLSIGLAAGVLALVAAELVARAVSSPSFDADAARADAERVVGTVNGERWKPEDAQTGDGADESAPEWILHPYYGLDYGTSDYWLRRDVKRFESDKAERAIDIVLLGGSVSVRFGTDCQRGLVDAFARDPRWAGWEARVYVQGRAAFRQPQLLHVLEYLLAIGFEPDIVVEIDGFNELALGAANANRGVHPAMPSIADWGPIASHASLAPAALDALVEVRREQLASQSWLARAERFGLFHSALTARFVASRLQGCLARYAGAAQRYEQLQAEPAARNFVAGPAFEGDEDAVIDACARIWADSSRMLDAICDRRGIRYVHVLQPTLHDRGSKPLTAEELERGAEPAEQIAAIERGYPKLRELGAELAADGVEFVDLSRTFAGAPQTLYEDICHFSNEGNQLLLAALAPILLSKPPAAAPPDAARAKPGAGKKRAK